MSKKINLEDFDEYKLIIKDVIEDSSAKSYNFPKYTTQIINIANQNSRATRPENVGQMSDLIKECPVKNFEGWKDWYLEHNQEKIEIAAKKVYDMYLKVYKKKIKF